jgi:hypothetical protein
LRKERFSFVDEIDDKKDVFAACFYFIFDIGETLLVSDYNQESRLPKDGRECYVPAMEKRFPYSEYMILSFRAP